MAGVRRVLSCASSALLCDGVQVHCWWAPQGQVRAAQLTLSLPQSLSWFFVVTDNCQAAVGGNRARTFLCQLGEGRAERRGLHPASHADALVISHWRATYQCKD